MESKINYVVGEKKKGRDHSDIKRELVNSDLSDEMVQHIMKEADSIYLDSLIVEKKPLLQFKLNKRLLGIILVIIGVLVTALTYTGIIDLGGIYIIFYGPILVGIALWSKDARTRLDKKRNRSHNPYNRWRK